LLAWPAKSSSGTPEGAKMVAERGPNYGPSKSCAACKEWNPMIGCQKYKGTFEDYTCDDFQKG
jgi:hypothetical protein